MLGIRIASARHTPTHDHARRGSRTGDAVQVDGTEDAGKAERGGRPSRAVPCIYGGIVSVGAGGHAEGRAGAGHAQQPAVRRISGRLDHTPRAPVPLLDERGERSRESAAPTATQKLVVTHETPLRYGEVAFGTEGIGSDDQAEPFHSSATVAPFRGWSPLPTAMQKAEVTHETAASVFVAVAAVGLGMVVQFDAGPAPEPSGRAAWPPRRRPSRGAPAP